MCEVVMNTQGKLDFGAPVKTNIFTRSKWSLLLIVSLSDGISIKAWFKSRNENDLQILFIRQQFEHHYVVYRSCEDAVYNNTHLALAKVCYKCYNLLWESIGDNTIDAHDDFLNDCWGCSSSVASGCVQLAYHESPSQCGDTFHAWEMNKGNGKGSDGNCCRAMKVFLKADLQRERKRIYGLWSEMENSVAREGE